MTRVAIQITGVVEHYDADGRLTRADTIQPAMVAGLTAAAIREACAGLGEQLATAFDPPVADVPAGDRG